MMKRLIVFLIVGLLLSAISVPTVSAQIENLPWGVERIRGDLPWDKDGDLMVDSDANAGQTIRVAVIDTGIANHPDLAGRVVDGISFESGEYWEDFIGHGTLVAGIIAAVDDGNHLIGVAPKVSLYAIKAYSTVQAWIDGINWAVIKGVHIISISQGIYEYNRDLETAVTNAHNSGVLLIAASGNNNAGIVMYPAAFTSVIAVGAIDQNDNRWVEDGDGSNYGAQLELAAPGENINSTFPPNTYIELNGTSYAVPHVTGTAALIWGSKVDVEYDLNGNGQWDSSEVRRKLRDTALDLKPPSGKDDYYGYGLVNAWYSSQRPPGDINYDLYVDMLDITLLAYFWGTTKEDPDWWYARPCDIDINNELGGHDLSILVQNFGKVDP